MRRTLLIEKLHRLRAIHAERDYEGSIAIVWGAKIHPRQNQRHLGTKEIDAGGRNEETPCGRHGRSA